MANKENLPANVFQHSDFGCAVCMKTSRVLGKETGIKMLSCSSCRGPRRYCSKECYKKDWEELGHKEECKLLAAECIIDDPKKKSAEVLVLKNEANELFKSGKYKEAILEYRKVKVLAIKVKVVLKKGRKKINKNEKESAETLCPYVKNMKNKNSKLVAELKVYHRRSDPLEIDMTRLAAIAANNTAITYNKLKMYVEACAAAREALKLDPLFHHRIIPQWMHSVKSLGDTLGGLEYALKDREKEWKEMGIRLTKLQTMLDINNDGRNNKTKNAPFALFMADFISYKEMIKAENDLFFDIIEKERKFADEGIPRFFPSFLCPILADKWGQCYVVISIVPAHGSQWLNMYIGNNELVNNNVSIQYSNIRFRPADLSQSDNDIDLDMIKDYRPGMLSHVATMEALRNAHREVLLLVHDLEREGMAVDYIVLGQGLFHMLPEEDDPQKDQRRHGDKANKYVLRPGHYLPDYCVIVPSTNHIRDYTGPTGDCIRVFQKRSGCRYWKDLGNF